MPYSNSSRNFKLRRPKDIENCPRNDKVSSFHSCTSSGWGLDNRFPAEKWKVNNLTIDFVQKSYSNNFRKNKLFKLWMCNFPEIVTNSFIGRIEGLLVHFRRLFCNIFNCVWQECAINHVTKLELADFTVYWALSSASFNKVFTFGHSSAWICSHFMLFSSPPAFQAIYNIGLSNLVYVIFSFFTLKNGLLL